MEIQLNSTKTIKEIQKEFSQKFPYLMIQFFGKNPSTTDVFEKGNKIENGNNTMGELYALETGISVNVNGHLKVETLENQFLGEFKIPVQVYRKSGSVWLQTIETNAWTLSEQNQHGEEMDRDIEAPKEDFDQFREQI